MRNTKNATSSKILVCDLKRERRALRSAVDRAVRCVLDSGWYILGKELEAFEREFAVCNGSRHAVGVASGTDALRISLAALGVGRGHEVITAVNTAIPTAMAIAATGARPVFVDVERETALIDAGKLGKAASRRTKAIIPVHLYGRPCDMRTIMSIARSRGIPVIEDCAQAQGASIHGRNVGTFGRLGAFSFYPTKNLGAYGDGGMIVTDDTALANAARLLRNYGQSSRYVCEIEGLNSRLDEVQAAILRVKLRVLGKANRRRRTIAGLYRKLLAGIPEVCVPVADTVAARHVYHLFVIRCESRDKLKRYLASQGVETQIHYPIPLHLQKAFRRLGYRRGDFPAAERLSAESLSLPIFPELSEKEVARISALVRKWYGYSR